MGFDFPSRHQLTRQVPLEFRNIHLSMNFIILIFIIKLHLDQIQ